MCVVCVHTCSQAIAGAPSAFPPMPPMPPFFGPMLPPPPMPPPNFTGLTETELRAMEGQERDNVEARIRCLRNIQVQLQSRNPLHNPAFISSFHLQATVCTTIIGFDVFRLGIVGRCSDGDAAVLQCRHQTEPCFSSVGCNGGNWGRVHRSCGLSIFDRKHNGSYSFL